jgi:hypothetical protein
MWAGNILSAVWNTVAGIMKEKNRPLAKESWKQLWISIVKAFDWWVDMVTTITSETVGAALEGKARILQKAMPKAPDATSTWYWKTFRHLGRGTIKFINGSADAILGTALITLPDMINNLSWQLHASVSSKPQQVIALPQEISNAVKRTFKRLWYAIVDPFTKDQEIMVDSPTNPRHKKRIYDFASTKRRISPNTTRP